MFGFDSVHVCARRHLLCFVLPLSSVGMEPESLPEGHPGKVNQFPGMKFSVWEINPEYSFEELMLKFQYLGHLMQRTDSLQMTLMLKKIEGRRKG